MNKRRMALVGLLGVSLLWASPILGARRALLSLIGPATSATNVTVASAGTGVKNCISDIDVVSASTYTFRMLNGSTTFYAMGPLAAGASLVRSWDIDTAPCGDAATAVQLKVDNGTFSINYNGYTQ